MLLFLATPAFPDPFSLLLSAAKLLKSVACRVFTVSNFSPKPTPIRLSLGVAQALALRAGWTKASRAPGSCQHRRRPAVIPALRDRKSAPAPTHLRLHVQLRATRAEGTQWEGPGRRGSRDPRSSACSRSRARALPAPAATNSAPHPPLLNSNGCHPTHLAPPAGTNSRRRHHRGPIAAPSASRGHTPPGQRLSF